jgi:hypothetical protein
VPFATACITRRQSDCTRRLIPHHPNIGLEPGTMKLPRIASALLFSLVAGWISLPAAAQEEPPSRVGRISVMEGDVWLRDASSPNPFIGTLNWPITQGTAFETGLSSRTEVRVGSTAIRFAPSTRARFDAMGEDTQRIALERGSLSIRLRTSEAARETVVVTAQGNVIFADSGSYRIDVGNDGEVNIAAQRGYARFDGRAQSITVGAGQQLQIFSEGRSQYAALPNDIFTAWVIDRDREFDRRPVARYVSPELTGADALEEYGSWSESSYGPVWYPAAYPVGWAPFRTGRWVWMQPWGWTWVDSQPWGFAVSHYGRWSHINGRWGWVPGQYVARPVWAPAVVAWAGGSRWSASINVGYPSVGWVPLAPYEVYTPHYVAPARYWQAVNSPYVRNVTVVNYVQQNPGSQSYANASVAGAVSAAASASTFARGAAANAAAGAATTRVAAPNTFVAVQSAAARDAFMNNRIVAPAMSPNTAPRAIAPAAMPAEISAASRGAAAAAGTVQANNPANNAGIGTQRMLPGQTVQQPGVPAVPPAAAQNPAAAAAAQAARTSPNYVKTMPVPAAIPPAAAPAAPAAQRAVPSAPVQPIQRVMPPKDLRAEQAAESAARRTAQQQQQMLRDDVPQRQPMPPQARPAPNQPPPAMVQHPNSRQQILRDAPARPAPQQRAPERAEPPPRQGGGQDAARDAAIRAIRER